MRGWPVCLSTTNGRVALNFFCAFEDLVLVRNTTAASAIITVKRIANLVAGKPARPLLGDLLALLDLLMCSPPSDSFWSWSSLGLLRDALRVSFSGPAVRRGLIF